jgi:hypothetical protein
MPKATAPWTPGPPTPDAAFTHGNAIPPQFVERRDFARREALSRRVLSEFTEMPGLVLTLEQAARLFGIGFEACGRILREHIERGQLRLTADAHYTLASRATYDS